MLGSACQQVVLGQIVICKIMVHELPDLEEATRESLDKLTKDNLELHKFVGNRRGLMEV